MTLYLSRLCLNPLFAPALRLAADPYELHRKLLCTVPCRKNKTAIAAQPKTADLLFRIEESDSGPIVLVQSADAPDWEALEMAPRAFRQPPETKPYIPNFSDGQRLSFRLLCQPSIRKSGQFGQKSNGKRQPGPRRACQTDEQLMEWLHRKAGDSGFRIESVGLTPITWLNTKRLQSAGGMPKESYDDAQKRAFRGNGKNLGGVRFDGVLIVADAIRLNTAIRDGIGPQKAFGFGLLSLARG